MHLIWRHKNDLRQHQLDRIDDLIFFGLLKLPAAAGVAANPYR
jgi:hypothetical protein